MRIKRMISVISYHSLANSRLSYCRGCITATYLSSSPMVVSRLAPWLGPGSGDSEDDTGLGVSVRDPEI